MERRACCLFADFSLVRRQPRPEFCHLGGMDLFRRQTHAGAYEAHKGRGVVPERLYAAVFQLRKLLAIILYALTYYGQGVQPALRGRHGRLRRVAVHMAAIVHVQRGYAQHVVFGFRMIHLLILL